MVPSDRMGAAAIFRLEGALVSLTKVPREALLNVPHRGSCHGNMSYFMPAESYPLIIFLHVPVPVRCWQLIQEVYFSSAFFSSDFLCSFAEMFAVKCSFKHLTLSLVNRGLMLMKRPVKRMLPKYLVPTHPLFPATLAVSRFR